MSTTIKTEVNLGEVYADGDSGFSGVAVTIVKWQFGCLRITLQPKVGDDGKLPESQAFDEAALVVGNAEVSQPIKPVDVEPGGDRPQPKHHPKPIR